MADLPPINDVPDILRALSLLSSQFQSDDQADGGGSPLSDGSRPATESLLHTQRVAEGLFDVSQLKKPASSPLAAMGALNRFDAYCSRLPQDRRYDAFDVSPEHVFRGRGRG